MGQSSALKKSVEQIGLVAPTDASVLIPNEVGDIPAANTRIRGRQPQTAAVAEPTSEVESHAALKQLEGSMILAALEQVDWKVAGSLGAGKLLGVKPTTLRSRMQVMGIRRWHRREE